MSASLQRSDEEEDEEDGVEVERTEHGFKTITINQRAHEEDDVSSNVDEVKGQEIRSDDDGKQDSDYDDFDGEDGHFEDDSSVKQSAHAATNGVSKQLTTKPSTARQVTNETKPGSSNGIKVRTKLRIMCLFID